MDAQVIIDTLRAELSSVRAIYVFGSRVSDEAQASSDLDVAVICGEEIDPLDLWSLSAKLAELVNCEVDLLNFMAASRVMQSQILIKGERIYCDVAHAGDIDAYQAFVLNDKLDLDRRRALQLDDIKHSGSVYD